MVTLIEPVVNMVVYFGITIGMVWLALVIAALLMRQISWFWVGGSKDRQD